MRSRTKEEITEEIARVTERIKALEDGDDTTSYDEALDCKGTVKAGGYDFYPSRILAELDPTAYRCGLNDYNDAELTDLNDELEQLNDELKETEEPEGVTQ